MDPVEALAAGAALGAAAEGPVEVRVVALEVPPAAAVALAVLEVEAHQALWGRDRVAQVVSSREPEMMETPRMVTLLTRMQVEGPLVAASHLLQAALEPSPRQASPPVLFPALSPVGPLVVHLPRSRCQDW